MFSEKCYSSKKTTLIIASILIDRLGIMDYEYSLYSISFVEDVVNRRDKLDLNSVELMM